MLAVSVIIGFALLLTAFGRSSCVVLPDGTMIGYNAIFPLYQSTLIDSRIWSADGKTSVRTNFDVLLSRHESDPDLVIMESPLGILTMDGREMIPLIHDYPSKDPMPGRESWRDIPLGEPILGTNLSLIQNALTYDPHFRNRFCRTPLFALHPPE
ncbi:hypothetical protein [Martelella sp. HB161492]|uniref:hypothetical protein n=1 Tax=Martelella sp. HB161492 TaxID=2720726 RepID=UPI0015912C80|nr:hypothetical protein [Martelella sp. HB161492]